MPRRKKKLSHPLKKGELDAWLQDHFHAISLTPEPEINDEKLISEMMDIRQESILKRKKKKHILWKIFFFFQSLISIARAYNSSWIRFILSRWTVIAVTCSILLIVLYNVFRQTKIPTSNVTVKQDSTSAQIANHDGKYISKDSTQLRRIVPTLLFAESKPFGKSSELESIPVIPQLLGEKDELILSDTVQFQDGQIMSDTVRFQNAFHAIKSILDKYSINHTESDSELKTDYLLWDVSTSSPQKSYLSFKKNFDSGTIEIFPSKFKIDSSIKYVTSATKLRQKIWQEIYLQSHFRRR